MFEHYIAAFSTMLLPQNLLAMCLGGLWGIVAGALPGISTSMGVVLLMPFTYAMGPVTAFAMLVSAYCGGITGGSITSILFGIPGEPSAVCTVIEGHALAKQGHAAHALWVFILASAIGGIFSVFVMMAATPLIANFALRFGPAEYFALTILGLSVVSGLSGDSVLKGVISCLFGLFLATIGTDGITGEERYTFDTTILLGGINFVSAMIGLLAISEIFIEAEEPFQEVKGSATYRGLKEELPTIAEYKEHWWTLTKSCVIGTLSGALPGGGATIASFLAYGEAARSSKNPERFGKGAIDGLMATEASNNASTGGSLTILLSLGIPANPAMAMLFSALIIYGIQPGPLFIKNNPDLFWGLVASMYLGNALLLLLNLPMIGIWVQVLKVPYRILFPLILLFCLIGAYSLDNSSFDVIVMILFGMLGYLMKKFKYDGAPLVLAFVLGPILEQSLRRSLMISGGSFRIFFTRPIACATLGLAFLLLLSNIFPYIKKRRHEYREFEE